MIDFTNIYISIIGLIMIGYYVLGFTAVMLLRKLLTRSKV